MKVLFSRKFLICFIPYFILYLLTSRNALFWDTIQFAGDHPNWYYSNNFRYFLLPDFCDSGHPPVFGMFIALAWKLLGRSLWVSHTVMLPFILLMVVQAIRTGNLLFRENKQAALLTTLLVLTESVLLTQCSLVSPDIWVAGFFLLALNAVLSRSYGWLTLAITIMGLISTRAMMCSCALYIFALSYSRADAGKSFSGWLLFALKKVLPFLPGAVLAIAYFAWHYHIKGWVGYPKNSTWAGGFDMVSPSRMFVNILILGWRIVDLGKIFTVIVFVVLLFQWFRKKIRLADDQQRNTAQSLCVLVLALFFITALPLALYQGLLTHRYLIPLTIGITILAAYLLFHSGARRSWMVVGIMVLVQLSGHFWNYPSRFSQGWEGSLGHLFFYGMQQDFRQFMQEKGIRKDEVATTANLMKSDYRTLMTDDTTAFRDFEKDSTTYVWYCNVANAMNEQVDYYYQHFSIVKKEQRGHVVMVLFKRPGELKPLPEKK